MIALNTWEMLAVSGGDMECFCIPKGANLFDTNPEPVRETLGDIDANICAQTCCGWLINAGWDYRGPDEWLSISPTGQIESKKRAISGSCPVVEDLLSITLIDYI